MNYRLLIQYDGTRYKGWQRLNTTDNTIQGKIENVLSRLIGEPVEITGASRTDAGVHAKGQVANVHLEKKISPRELKDYLNQYLPEDIEILGVKEVSSNFHARYNAGNKTYSYTIAMKDRKQVFERKYMHHISEELDISKMKEAAQFFHGEHDFQSFCAKKMKKSTFRTIENIDFSERNGILRINYIGSGFLYHMVRLMTGTLIEIGLGSRQPESIIQILRKRERKVAGALSPAKGLCLEKIDY